MDQKTQKYALFAPSVSCTVVTNVGCACSALADKFGTELFPLYLPWLHKKLQRIPPLLPDSLRVAF